MMTIVDICRPSSTPFPNQPMDLCFRIFPCLADPGSRLTDLSLNLLFLNLIIILFNSISHAEL